MPNTAQVLLLAARLRLFPRQIRCLAAMVTAVRNSPRLDSEDERMRASDIVIATGAVESNWTIYANGNNPDSMRLYHEAVGWDHGSVGPLQQQVGGAPNSTANWGTTSQCMSPAYAAGKFVSVLVSRDWKHMSNGVAAQSVQGSAFPDRYAQRDAQAIKIRKTIWKYCDPHAATAPVVKPVPTKPKPGTKPNSGKVVTVKSGDTLGMIAKKNGVSLQALLRANPRAGHPAGNTDVIWPGDKVRIP